MKHFDAMTWVLGWGVYSNSRAIKQIKDNLGILGRTKSPARVQDLFAG